MSSSRYIHKNFSSILGVFFHFFSFFFIFSQAYALDSVAQVLSWQTATTSWSNNSQISVSVDTQTGATVYMNKDSDSTIVGNYFSGYYYDTQFGFFKLDWSTDMNQNVRITGSIWCDGGWYGYMIGWYAYSDAAGYIDFWYPSSNPVHYCESDQKLHWYAYSQQIWFQSFEGVRFQVWTDIPVDNFTKTSDPFFVNNNTIILTNQNTNPIIASPDMKANTIQGDQISTDWGKEAIFYITKTTFSK